jgi:hypothetical protein
VAAVLATEGTDASRVQDPELRAAVEADAVAFLDVMIAAAKRNASDQKTREVGENDYPILLARFMKKHVGAEINVQDSAGIGACLHTGDDGELELIAVRASLRFHWHTARDVQKELNGLDDDARRWLRKKERRGFRLRIYDIATQVHTTVGTENRRHDVSKIDQDPTEFLEPELASIRVQVGKARSRLAEEAERAAQARYAMGMLVGAGILALLFAIGGLVFAADHIPAVYGIGSIAGGIGACLSVFQRLTKQRLKLSYRTDAAMLLWFGALRPAVGAVVGLVAFAIIKSGVLSGLIVIPTEAGPLLAYVAVIAFLAAFSERFFQDMLRVAQPAGISIAPPIADDDSYTPTEPEDTLQEDDGA